MKKLLYFIITIWLITNIVFAHADVKKTRVFISKLVDHPALDATTKGIIDELINSGYKLGDNLDLRVESAQGSAALAGQIANKFVSQNPDIVVGVGTITAQSFAKYARQGQVKMIFTTVTDPLEAGLVNELTRPGNNISGISNFVPLEPQLELFKKIKPGIKKLGFLYNPGEQNSLTLIKKLEEICPKFNLILVKQVASKSADILQSATMLAEGCDAIFISNDSTALSALPTIVKAANNANIPLFVSDIDAVSSGATAALGPNQYAIGKQTARMIIRILKGADISQEAVEFSTQTELYINLKAARRIGITISDDLLKQATYLIND